MSPAPSLGRVVSKILPSKALRYQPSSSSRSLASTRIVQDRSCKARPFSSVVIIPGIGSEHQSDIPSARVLSRLDISDPWRDEADINIERKQELVGRAHETQRQQRETRKKNESNVMISPYPVADGGGGRTTDDQSQHDGHGSEDADTWTCTDASVPGYSGGYSGGYDGDVYGGGGDCRGVGVGDGGNGGR